MAEDPTGNVVMFGGQRVTDILGDTWTFDGTAWNRYLGAGPSARSGASVCLDPLRQETVLFGGVSVSGYPTDTWVWNGTSWAQRAGSGPLGRRFASLVWDAARGRVLLAGGTRESALSDLWEWDGVSWTSVGVHSLGESAAFGPDPLGGQLILTDLFPGTWLRTSVPASTSAFGVACAGAGGQPRLLVDTVPSLAAVLTVEFAGLEAQAPAALLIGATETDLALGGGCRLYLDPAGVAFTWIMQANSSGRARQALQIPPVPGLLGLVAFLQGYALDSARPHLGGVFSHGLRLSLGR